MFLKFSNFFVCFLIVTMLHPYSFAAEEDSQSTEPATEVQNAQAKESTVDTESVNTETIDENIEDEFSEKTTIKQDSFSPPSTNFLEATQQRKVQQIRAPVVSTSEISNAIDKDYSFLYDPDMKPDLITDMTNNPDSYVIMYLETGDSILIKLKENIAPNTVIRFRKLVKDRFYDDMEIFRAIPDYLIQTGDPSGSGYGGKGIFYFAEINPDEKFKRGSVAMSNNGNLQSDDTQFFITFNSFDWLDGNYTIFGEVVLGMTKLENISKSFVNDGFVTNPAIITKIEILSQRPADRVDDLSTVIPLEKQKEAIRKQEENNRREKARQKFLIENEKEKDTLNRSRNYEETTVITTKDNSNDSVDEQAGAKSNPYLESRKRR